MKKNNLFASMASKALALAVAMMMSVAFTACNKDNGKEPEPEPTFTNTVTLDGKTMPVVSAEYEDKGDGRFAIFLNHSQGITPYTVLDGSTVLHIGKDINLVSKEPDGQEAYWYLGYESNSGWLFLPNGNPTDENPVVFTTGTLRIEGNPMGGETTVSLKNGKITDAVEGDGKEHTISINWKGKATKI